MLHTIEFVLFPGALGLDIMGPLEVFNTATELLRQPGNARNGYKSRFVAAIRGAVRLSSGLQLLADNDFQEESMADTLFIPGGDDLETVIADPVFMGYIKRRAGQVSRMISVCKGAFILAAAGLLDGREATTHWISADELAGRYPQVNVNPDAIFIKDGQVYTSAGVMTGIDLALSIVEEDHGAATALAVSRLLVMYFRRPGSQSQFSLPLKAQEAAGKQFASLHAWLVENLTRPITVEQMAEFSAMSERNFTRRFKAKTGMTPGRYLETLRLDRAREIMISGDNALNQIAEESGFIREERLRRAFLRRFGLTPTQYRLHFIQTRNPQP